MVIFVICLYVRIRNSKFIWNIHSVRKKTVTEKDKENFDFATFSCMTLYSNLDTVKTLSKGKFLLPCPTVKRSKVE